MILVGESLTIRQIRQTFLLYSIRVYNDNTVNDMQS